MIGTSSTSAADVAFPKCLGKAATIVGTSGNDVLKGTSGDDVIAGLAGKDRIFGVGGNDRICGGQGDDKLLSGGEGNDLIDGDDGIDTLEGGPGADDLRLGPNTLKEVYKGDETFYFYAEAKGGPGDDVISGGDGPDEIDGGEGNDRLDGGSDDDNLSGGLGDDVGQGGRGHDDWDFTTSADGEVDHFFGGAGNDSSGYDSGCCAGPIGRARQIQYGGSGDDRLGGGVGDDLLIGGPGDDLLYPAEGDDDVRGGTGRDTVDYADGGTGSSGSGSHGLRYPKLEIDLQLGTATGLGEDRLRSIEGVIGGSNADVLLGTRGVNMFWLSDLPEGLDEGNSGIEDVIDGRGGHDTIGPAYFGYFDYRVDLGRGTARQGLGGWARLVSIEGAVGTFEDDVLLGDDHANTFRGLPGADVIRGRGGSDRIWGDTGGEEVNSAADRLYGGAGADTIYGGLGRDRVYGGSGRDRLYGGSGQDRLDGDSGLDRNDGGSGRDLCLSPSNGARARSCGPP